MNSLVLAVRSSGNLLINLIKALEEAKIKTCILHGYKTYPELIPSDVDIVVDCDDFNRLSTVLMAASHRIGVQLVQVIQHEATCYAYIFSNSANKARFEYLQLDVALDYRISGRILFNADEFLSSRRRFREFWVPAPHLEFSYYLVKKIAKGFMGEQHSLNLLGLYWQAPEKCEAQILRFWSPAVAQEINRAMVSNNLEDLRAELQWLHRDFLRATARKFPLSVVFYWWAEFQRMLKRLLQPTGLLVVLLGPDGAGKSSVLGVAEKRLGRGFSRTALEHLRPCLFGSRKESAEAVTNPHGKRPHSGLKSIIKLGYFWFDYTFGYLLKLRPKLVRSTLIFFDRYYCDLLIDPKRYRYGGPMWLACMTSRLIPTPDMLILLDVPPEILQQRKQEVPFEESARQREAYLKLVKSLPNGYIVDASCSLDKVVVDVQRIILNYMAERTSSRLRLEG